MSTICGIDEAGRGPIIGPMVMAGVLIEEKDEIKLENIGVKDSKLLTKEKRKDLFSQIIKIVKKYEISISDPKEIDKAVDGVNSLNLNKLEAIKSAGIINILDPNKAIVDCPSTNIGNYKKYLQSLIKNKKTELTVEHKADFKYVVVAAASILAKVIRDRNIDEIKDKIKIDIGSGYPSDPRTIEFIEKNHKKYPDILRKSWQTYKNLINRQNQTTLRSFTSKEKDFSKHKKKIRKLKQLKGYEEIPVKTIHEVIRFKGPCTITLYKTGKLLIQGKEKYKKEVEKLLG